MERMWWWLRWLTRWQAAQEWWNHSVCDAATSCPRLMSHRRIVWGHRCATPCASCRRSYTCEAVGTVSPSKGHSMDTASCCSLPHQASVASPLPVLLPAPGVGPHRHSADRAHRVGGGGLWGGCGGGLAQRGCRLRRRLARDWTQAQIQRTVHAPRRQNKRKPRVEKKQWGEIGGGRHVTWSNTE